MSSATAETSLDKPAADGLIFGPHYYDPTVMLLNEWTGGSDLSLPMGRLRDTADGWDLPVLLGEFGARSTCLAGDGYLRAVYAALDARLMHATVWEYSWDELDWNDEGYSLVDASGQESALVAEVTRAYPAAVAGTLTSFEYDPSTRAGRVTYQALAAGLTEIAAPLRLFPDGIDAEVTGAPARWSYDAAAQRLLVLVEQAGQVSVRFSPAR